MTLGGFFKKLLQKSVKGKSTEPHIDRTLLASVVTFSTDRVVQRDSRFWARSSDSSFAKTGGASPSLPPVRYVPGALIGGRYEVLNVFGGPGKSGMGVVYLVWDRWDKQQRAIKTFQDPSVWNKRVAAVFRREAELWIGMGHHAHIVRAHTVRKPDGRLCLVLEFIGPDAEGRNTLTHHLQGYPLPLERVLTWGIQFCRGMDFASAHGITVHRDIKPDNIMIDAEGRVKITDFGLAKSLDGDVPPEPAAGTVPRPSSLSVVATKEGSCCGSPPWMSPEQFGDAKHADVRSDIYSFGVVLFQMLTGGLLPFEGNTLQDYATLHLDMPPPPLPEPLGPVVSRCLQKSPKDRYQEFSVLRRELEQHAAELRFDIPGTPPLPVNAERLKDWAASLCYLQRYEEALVVANQAVDMDPDFVAARINRSLCFLNLNQPREAVEDLKTALALEPENALAWNNLACAHKRLGRMNDAFAAAQKAIQLDGAFRDAWNTLGGLHQQQPDFKKAIECYRKALDVDPFFCDAYVNLGDALCGTGGVQEALCCYQRAAEIDPEDGTAIERRNRLSSLLGDTAPSR